jgi:hypothetical protein
MSGKRLKPLRQIAAAFLDAELARLRAARAKADRIAAKIADHDAAGLRQQEAIAAELEAPVAGPVYDRWGAWAGRHRAALNIEFAQALAALETQKHGALTAFGRAEALRRIAEAQAAAVRQKARRG